VVSYAKEPVTDYPEWPLVSWMLGLYLAVGQEVTVYTTLSIAVEPLTTISTSFK